MTRASTPTLLSLDRFAKILGLNPVHFAGAQGDDVWPPGPGACEDIWPQHSWQSFDLISREELARQISIAETSIMRVLGYAVAPTWFAGEEQPWPHLYDANWRSRRQQPMISTRYRHIIAGGRRKVDLLSADLPIVYSDEDGDTFPETATVVIADFSLDGVCDVHLYFSGHEADPTWEIRPIRSMSVVGTDLIIELDSWLLLDPDLWERHPLSAGLAPISATDANNYVTSLAAYHVYNDTTAVTAQLLSPTGFPCSSCGGTGCERCATDGCLVVRDGALGQVLVSAAISQNTIWQAQTFDVAPITAKLWYYAGYQSQQYQNGYTCDPLDDLLAEAIVFLTVARLNRPLCSCSNVRQQVDDLRVDYAFSDRNRINMIWRDPVVARNPFGSKAGEVRAYRIVQDIMGDAVIGGTL